MIALKFNVLSEFRFGHHFCSPLFNLTYLSSECFVTRPRHSTTCRTFNGATNQSKLPTRSWLYACTDWRAMPVILTRSPRSWYSPITISASYLLTCPGEVTAIGWSPRLVRHRIGSANEVFLLVPTRVQLPAILCGSNDSLGIIGLRKLLLGRYVNGRSHWHDDGLRGKLAH